MLTILARRLFKQYTAPFPGSDTFVTYGINKQVPRYDTKACYPVVDCHLIDRASPANYFVIGEPVANELIKSLAIPRRIEWREFLLSLVLVDMSLFSDIRFLFRLFAKNNGSSVSPLNNQRGRRVNRFLHILKALLVSRYVSLKFLDIAERSPRILVTQYYCSMMLGVVRAARLCGTSVIEIQHGYIGADHYAYNRRAMFSGTSTYRPSSFLVFTPSFKEQIERCTGLPAESTNFLHLRRFVQPPKPGSPPKILYSLQWATPVPHEFGQAIKLFHNYQWIFRFHPLEESERQDLQWLSQLPNVEFERDKLLSDSLADSSAHITFNSSTCFEAQQLGVPSFYFDPQAKARFDGNPLIHYLSIESGFEALKQFLPTPFSAEAQHA